jgi:hypothetical protein
VTNLETVERALHFWRVALDHNPDILETPGVPEILDDLTQASVELIEVLT